MDFNYTGKKIGELILRSFNIAVLMSTFNGERYIHEQIKSIFSQENVNVSLHIWDDGSSDRTLQIIKKWQDAGFPILIQKGAHLGSSKAFLNLLLENQESDFFAFSDQDDIWEPNRLILQAQAISTREPTLVVAQRKFIDINGHQLRKKVPLRKCPTRETAIVENLAPGNLQFFNSAAAELILRNIDDHIKHYDHWIFLLLSFRGRIIFTPEAIVNYRIHESNQIGIKRFPSPHSIGVGVLDSLRQLKTLLILNENLAKSFESLHAFQSLFLEKRPWKRIYLVLLRCKVRRSRRIESYVWKFVFLILVIFNAI